METCFRLAICATVALSVWFSPTSSTSAAEVKDREDCLQHATKQIVQTCTYYDRKFSGQGNVPAWDYDRELIRRLDIREFEDAITIDPYRDDAEQQPGPHPERVET